MQCDRVLRGCGSPRVSAHAPHTVAHSHTYTTHSHTFSHTCTTHFHTFTHMHTHIHTLKKVMHIHTHQIVQINKITAQALNCGPLKAEALRITTWTSVCALKSMFYTDRSTVLILMNYSEIDLYFMYNSGNGEISCVALSLSTP